MSDGIFYYPKYLLYEEFIYITLAAKDDVKNLETLKEKRVYMNDNEE